MKVLLLVLVLCFPVFSQQEECDHKTDAWSRFESTRLLPPVKVTYFDGKKIEWLYQSKFETRVGSVEVEDGSALDPIFTKEYTKHYWWVLYCMKDYHLYTVVKVTPAQMKEVPR